MKIFMLKSCAVFVVLISAMYLSSCKGSDDPTEKTQEEIFLDKIGGSWKPSVILLDGKDVSQSFPGMIISISENKTITVTNPVPPIWKGSATFVLQPNGSTFLVKRDDGLVISVPESSATRIVLTFEYDPSVIKGRIESIKGQFRFELTP